MPVKRPVAWLYPVGAERAYSRALVREFALWFKEIDNLLDTFLPEIDAEARKDSPIDWLNTMLTVAKDRFGSHLQSLSESVVFTAKKIDEWNHKQFIRVIYSAVGVEVIVFDKWKPDATRSFVEHNVSMIKNLSEKAVSDIERIVYDGVMAGKRVQTIRKEIKALKGMQKRAAFIAEDQVGKFNGLLTKNRQTGIGIKSYVWRTSMDERVRNAHRDREGKVISWEKPPMDGHPGMAPHCRCYAEPNIAEFIRMISRN